MQSYIDFADPLFKVQSTFTTFLSAFQSFKPIKEKLTTRENSRHETSQRHRPSTDKLALDWPPSNEKANTRY